MAITKNTVLERIEVLPAVDPAGEATENTSWPTVVVITHVTFDDDTDDLLPVTNTITSYLEKFDSEGNATDASAHGELVVNVCNGAWEISGE